MYNYIFKKNIDKIKKKQKIFFLLIINFFFYLFRIINNYLKEVHHLLGQKNNIQDSNIFIQSINGESLDFYPKKQKISKLIKQAFIATEDAKFYRHRGIDLNLYYVQYWLILKILVLNRVALQHNNYPEFYI